MNIRTRIAPSPTGNPHIGTIYQALFDYAFAKKHHGHFIVRIEDTDRARLIQGAEEKIYQALDWFNLTEDESPRRGGSFGPYRQSERLNLYQKYARQLINTNHAYYCYCSKDRLEKIRQIQQAEKKMPMYDKHCRYLDQDEIGRNLAKKIPYIIRLKIPENTVIKFHDQIRGEISFSSKTIDDQVLLKADGFPTYHLAVVIDDHLMQVSHIIRAEEWLPSTPKHVLLYQYLDWEMPPIFHTATLRNPDRSKLSKRHGHTNVDWYMENGYLPEAILNFLALLGWSHPDGKEIFTLDEFIRYFDLKDIRPVAPIFDVTKLTWMNQQYIIHMPDNQLLERIKQFYSKPANIILSDTKPDAIQYLTKDLEEDNTISHVFLPLRQAHGQNDSTLRQLLPLVRERMQTLKDFKDLASHFYTQPEIHLRGDLENKIAKELLAKLSEVKEWKKEPLLASLKEILNKFSLRMPVLYYLLTGKEKGLPLPESLEILGKEITVSRLTKLINQ